MHSSRDLKKVRIGNRCIYIYIFCDDPCSCTSDGATPCGQCPDRRTGCNSMLQCYGNPTSLQVHMVSGFLFV